MQAFMRRFYEENCKVLLPAMVALCMVGCSIVPKGSVVLSDTFLSECKLKDVSEQYDGRYLRVTDIEGQGGKLGGRATHRHSFGHEHSERLNVTLDTRQPLGTEERASGSAHKHLLKSDRQTPTITDEASNEVSHIRWALFEANGSCCLPAGTIVGFIGNGVPDGWSEVNGIEDVYIRVSTDDLNTIVSKDSAHTHNIQHDHRFLVYKPKPNDGNSVRSFRPGTQFDVSPIVHGHQIESSQFKGNDISSNAEPQLSYFKLRFIRLDEKATSLPRGVVVLYTGTGEPCGWLRLDQAATEPVSGTFLMLAGAGTQREVVHYPWTHTHTMDHGHTIKTGTPTDTDTRKLDSGINDPIAVAAHTHSADIELELEGESTEHLPLYLEVHLLMKK